MRGRSRRLGPSSGCDRVSACQAERGRDCQIPDTGEVRGSRGAGGRSGRGPGAPTTSAQTPQRGLAGARRPGQRSGLITRNRSADTRRPAASEQPRPSPLAAGPRQRPREAARCLPFSAAHPHPDSSLPFPSHHGKPACPQAAAPPQPTSEAAPGAYLVILINDFGWDFLANDLPEDRVATRPGGLSLSDLICHLGLPPARPSGEKVGRREEPWELAEGGSWRPNLRGDRCSLAPAARARAHWRRVLGCCGRAAAVGESLGATKLEGGS